VTLNRKALRTDLKSKLEAALVVGVGVAAVYESLPKSLGGQSPVITIESGPSTPTVTPEEPQSAGIIMCLWVRRDDADTAEDGLDDFMDAVIRALDANYNYDWAKPTGPDYEIDDGVLYRIEWLNLTFQWW
jgi:hypothetical protein